MDVVLVRWPLERDRWEKLVGDGRLRLLLVEQGEDPPVSIDPAEDWIRVPAPDHDVQLRVDRLRLVAEAAFAPVIDQDGLLRHAQRWVSLAPVEARLMGALIGRVGAVVSREQLARAGWPDGAPGRNALDVHMLRLRRRIAELGLSIKTVRSRGYLLEASSPSGVADDRRRA